ncbi:MAG: hypothetical protein ABW098_07565 [Candidatus Thiodiazotropha sp.]
MIAPILYCGIASIFLTCCASVDDAWLKAEKENSRSSYITFNLYNRDNKYTKTAQERIDGFDWDAAKQDGTEEAYRAFIRDRRSDKFLKEAKAELAWLEAQRKPSLHRYAQFLINHPDSPHITDAKKALPVQLAKQQEEAETESFKRLRSSGTYCQMTNFLENHPNSTHTKEVVALKRAFVKKTFSRDTLIKWDDPRRHVVAKLYDWTITSLSTKNKQRHPKLAADLSRMRKLQKHEKKHTSLLNRPLPGQQIADRIYLDHVRDLGSSGVDTMLTFFGNTSGPILSLSNTLLLVEAGVQIPYIEKAVAQTKVINVKVLGCDSVELTAPDSAMSTSGLYTLVPIGSTLKLSADMPLHIFGIEVQGGSIAVTPDGLHLSKGTTLYYKSSKNKVH